MLYRMKHAPPSLEAFLAAIDPITHQAWREQIETGQSNGRFSGILLNGFATNGAGRMVILQAHYLGDEITGWGAFIEAAAGSNNGTDATEEVLTYLRGAL